MARRIIQFNILAVTALIATFFPGGQVLAEETYSGKASLLADIAVQYTAAGQSEQAVKLLDQALPLTKAITNECFKGTPLVKVAGGYILAGQEAKGKQLLAQAIQVARTQTATGCHMSATSPEESLLNRAKEYAEAGYYDLAVEIITAVNNPVFSPLALGEVAGHYAKAGESEQATKVINQAIAIARRFDDARYRTMTLIGIAEHLSQAGQKEQVPQVLERALESVSAMDEAQSSENASMKVNHTLRIAKQFAQVGQDRRAIELLDQTLPKIRTVADKPFPSEKTSQLVETAIQYAALEQKNKAIETLAEVRTAAQAMDEARSKSDALAKVANAYAEIGNFEQAEQIARLIEDVYLRESAFGKIAIAYAKAGYADKAVKLAKSIGNPNGTLIGIARHYLAKEQYDQALQFVQKWNVKGLMSELALAYLKAGQPDQALQLVQKGNIEGFMPEIALGYVKAGQPDQARQIVESIPSSPDTKQQMEWMLPAIAGGLAEQGQFDQALQVARAITDKSYKAEALTAIAEQYVAREPEKKGPIQQILSVFTSSFNSLFGDSNKDKASEILEQALQLTNSIAPKR
jgi:tetratricopeptide (TPR) repeat protein